MFKDTLKYLRKSYNLTQKELAQKINVAQSSIAMLENGRNDANASTLTALSDFFGVSIDYLLGREDDLGNPIYQKKAAASPQPPSISTLSNDEQLLLDYYRRLPPRNKLMLFNLFKSIFEEARDLPTEQAASWIGTIN